MTDPVGILGLGIMGSVFARHLIDAGKRVVGYDINPLASDRLAVLGGEQGDSPRDVANRCSIVLSCLPSEDALDNIIAGHDGLKAEGNRNFTLVECSTVSLGVKYKAAQHLQSKGAIMIDCPISGTGVQAANKDIVFYASGDQGACNLVTPVLELLGREVFFLGELGNGTKMKLVSNLLVAIHNVAAAEAIVLARKAGLDLDVMMQAVLAGAGTSKMLETRGPMMISGEFNTGLSSRLDVFQKDLRAITSFCEGAGAPSPVFALCNSLYQTAISQGWEQLDPGSVFKVIEQLSTADGDHTRTEN